MHTFFLPESGWHEPYRIAGPEARHMATVLRTRPGDRVRLLDGMGREGVFRVTAVGKNAVDLAVEEIVHHARPAGRATLAIGYGKGLRRGWLLEKAVELEAAGIWLWQAERSQGQVPDQAKETWLAQMAAGAKQSRNPWLPEVRTLPGGVRELAGLRESFAKAYVLWEDESAERVLAPTDFIRGQDTLFVLGPEGGFSSREIACLREAGYQAVSLGGRVLRWETAAMLCLGMAWWLRQQT